jgi:PBP1b-binding outer membrane lipoprotein LpoB
MPKSTEQRKVIAQMTALNEKVTEIKKENAKAAKKKTTIIEKLISIFK